MFLLFAALLLSPTPLAATPAQCLRCSQARPGGIGSCASSALPITFWRGRFRLHTTALAVPANRECFRRTASAELSARQRRLHSEAAARQAKHRSPACEAPWRSPADGASDIDSRSSWRTLAAFSNHFAITFKCRLHASASGFNRFSVIAEQI